MNSDKLAYRTASAIRSLALSVAVLAAPTGAIFAQTGHSIAPVVRAAAGKPPTARPAKPASILPAPVVKMPDKPATVTVRPNCEVGGAAFTLGEIADIQGEDSALTAQLSSIEIGASPLPGLSRIINPGDITVRVRQHKLDGPRVDLVLPPGIRITRLGHDIAPDEITRAAIESAHDAIKSMPDATLEPAAGVAKLVVPAGKAQILAGAWRGNPEIGTVTVPVSVVIDGKPVQLVDVVLRIRRKTMALVARHDIQLHDIIGPQDVTLMLVELTPGHGSPITAIEGSIGKRSTRKISANSPISIDMLEKAPLIAANDTITIEFVIGALRVTASGVARQGGAEGDSIHVYASETRRELTATVVDKHTVRVEEFDN